VNENELVKFVLVLVLPYGTALKTKNKKMRTKLQKHKEIFCRRSGKFYLGIQIDKSSLERVFLKGSEVVNSRNLYDLATKSIANLKKALTFMGKYVDMESGIVMQSGLEIEDVIQKFSMVSSNMRIILYQQRMMPQRR